ELLQVVVDGRDLHVVELRRHLLTEPNVLVGVDGLDAARAAGGDKGEVLGRRGAHEGSGGLLLASHVAHPASPTTRRRRTSTRRFASRFSELASPNSFRTAWTRGWPRNVSVLD